jgi:hypothetical protein
LSEKREIEMLNTYEKNTLLELKGRVLNGEVLSVREKQLILDLLRREGSVVKAEVLKRAANEGLNTTGILTV